MRLSELAAAVPGAAVGAGGGFEVRRVVQDSRLAGPGDLFVAVRGLRADGHDFAAAAASRGAAVAAELPLHLPPGSAFVRLPDTRAGLGQLAGALWGRPARRLLVVGVTGSAGKTTTTHLAAHVLEAAGLPAGYLSTVAVRAAGAPDGNRSGQTTMEAPEVQAWLARMVAGGARAAVIEASSHALEQGRVAACDFDVAAFTNVGTDHLDYHGSAQSYLRAKARLIELCAAAPGKGVEKTAVLNRDDPSYDALAAYDVPRRLTYGTGEAADVRAVDVRRSGSGMAMRIAAGGAEAPVQLPLPAMFNVANALCAAACALALGRGLEEVAAGLSSFSGLSGRLERVDRGQPFRVYVDFAHSAVGLASLLRELRSDLGGGRLLAVFGATARSDHDPAGMGAAAARHADHFVITTDDPLDVDPVELARRVEAGAAGRARGRDYDVLLDRRAAIRRAVGLARAGDVVVLAGKGHERTMQLASGPVPWDDRAEAEAALRDLGW